MSKSKQCWMGQPEGTQALWTVNDRGPSGPSRVICLTHMLLYLCFQGCAFGTGQLIGVFLPREGAFLAPSFPLLPIVPYVGLRPPGFFPSFPYLSAADSRQGHEHEPAHFLPHWKQVERKQEVRRGCAPSKPTLTALLPPARMILLKLS